MNYLYLQVLLQVSGRKVGHVERYDRVGARRYCGHNHVTVLRVNWSKSCRFRQIGNHDSVGKGGVHRRADAFDSFLIV